MKMHSVASISFEKTKDEIWSMLSQAPASKTEGWIPLVGICLNPYELTKLPNFGNVLKFQSETSQSIFGSWQRTLMKLTSFEPYKLQFELESNNFDYRVHTIELLARDGKTLLNLDLKHAGSEMREHEYVKALVRNLGAFDPNSMIESLGIG